MRKLTAATLGIVLFLNNSVFADSLQINLWSERKAPTRDFPALPPIRKTGLIHSGLPQKYSALLSALPRACASVRGVVLPRGKDAGVVVVHIQDVHMNAEAQSHIGKTVQALIDSRAIGLVALEGAFEPLDFARFRNFPYSDVIESVADYFLKTDRITGPVHAALTSKTPIPPFVGVDDRLHYRSNVRAYTESVSGARALKAALRSQEAEIINRKRSVFGPALLEFDNKVTLYRAGRLRAGDYAAVLSSRAKRHSENFSDFEKAFRMESALDFAAVEKERAALLQRLVPRLDARQTNSLAAQSVAYQAGQLGYADFYGFLVNLCGQARVPLNQFPLMSRYVEYALTSDRIKAEPLFKEFGEMERAIYARVTKTEEERALVAASRRLYLTGKLVDFALTNEEWNEYKPSRAELTPFERFYVEAEARDKAMAGNLLKAAHGAAAIVLVTGGFHSAGIDALLAEKGMTVLNVVPQISKLDKENGSAYLGVFSREKTPLEKLFKGEKLYLTKPVFPDPVKNGGFALYAAAVAIFANLPLAAQQSFNQLSAAPGRIFRATLRRGIASISCKPAGAARMIALKMSAHRVPAGAGNPKIVIDEADESAVADHASLFIGVPAALVLFTVAHYSGLLGQFAPGVVFLPLFFIAAFRGKNNSAREKVDPVLADLAMALAPFTSSVETINTFYRRYLSADRAGKNQLLEYLWTLCADTALALDVDATPPTVAIRPPAGATRLVAIQVGGGLDFSVRFERSDASNAVVSAVALSAGGSSANVARVLTRLGTAVNFAGVIGEGPRGTFLSRLLARAGIDTSSWIRSHGDNPFYFLMMGRELPEKDRFEHRLAQPSSALSSEARAHFFQRLEEHLRNSPRPILYLGSRPPAGEAAFFFDIFRLAKKYRAYVVYDPKPDVLADPVLRDALAQGGVGLFNPNLEELALALRLEESDLKTKGAPDKEKIVRLVRERLIAAGFAETVLVSMEQRGALLIDKNRVAFAETEDKVIGVDSVGAGDAGLAGLLDQLVRLDLDPRRLSDEDFTGALNVFVAASDATAKKFGDLASPEDIVATLPKVKSSLGKTPAPRTSNLLNEDQTLIVESDRFKENLAASGSALFRRAGALEVPWYSWNFDWRRFLSDKLINFASTYPDSQKNIFYFTISLGDAQLRDYSGGPRGWWSAWKRNGREYEKVIKNMADLAKPENRWLVRFPSRVVIALAALPFLSRIFGAIILWMVKNIMARRFFIGEELFQAERTIQILKDQGLQLTVDNVGEMSLCAADTEKYVTGYLTLIDNKVPAISVKLSNMTAHFNPNAWEKTKGPVIEQMKIIIAAAEKIGAEVTIDMEDYVYKDFTIQTLLDLLEQTKYPKLGIAIQAYLRDTRSDLLRIVRFVEAGKTRGIPPPLIRLVKGANMVPDGIEAAADVRPSPQFSYKAETDINYERCAEFMLRNREFIRPAFGTHNVRSMAVVIQLAKELGVRDDEFELQYLYGMVRDEVVRAVHEIKLGGDGVQVRFYGPFGSFIRGLGYFVRRLVEKTDANSFLLVQGYSKEAEERALRDPRAVLKETLDGGGKITTPPASASRDPILPAVRRGLDAAQKLAGYFSKVKDGAEMAAAFSRCRDEVIALADGASKSLLDLPGRTNELIVAPRGNVVFVSENAGAADASVAERLAAPLAAGNKVLAFLSDEQQFMRFTIAFEAAGVPRDQVELHIFNEAAVAAAIERNDIDSFSYDGPAERAAYYHGLVFDRLSRFLPTSARPVVEGTPDRNFVSEITPDHVKEFVRTRVLSEYTNRAGFATRGKDVKGLPGFKNAANVDLFRAENQLKLERQVRLTNQRAWNETIPLMIDSKPVRKQFHPLELRGAADPDYKMGLMSLADAADVDAAVKSARAAQPAWEALGPKARAEILLKFADLAERGLFEFAALEMVESGKNAEEAIADIREGIDFARFYALDAIRAEKEEAERTRPGSRWAGWKTRANGVSAVISPWNFPFAIPAGQILSSLAAGNAVVFKPSEKSPHMGFEIFKLLREAGLPDGVLNFVPGKGDEAGEALVNHSGVDEVLLTGSAKVGLGIKEKTAKEVRPDGRPHKNIIAELGGNNAIIVDEGADIELAIKIILASAFGFSAQKCSAANRVIVLDSLYGKFSRRLKEAAEALPDVMGDPRRLGTFFGPLIDRKARDGMKDFIARMKRSGANALIERTTADDLTGFIIFDNVDPDSELAQKEQFFPTLSLIRARDFQHAVRLLNHTPYALTGGLLSQNSEHIDYFRERANVGNATVNGKITGAVVGQQAFGGSGLSGFSGFYSKAGGMGHAWWAHRRWVRKPEPISPPPEFSSIRYEVKGGVARVIFNRPDKMNAATPDMLAEIKAAIAFAQQDEAVHTIVLRGTGKAFMSGADLSVSEGMKTREQKSAWLSQGQDLAAFIASSPKPVVAALNGFAFGGGLELALGAHYRVAEANAVVGLVETKLGLIPGWGGTQRLPRLVKRLRDAVRMIVNSETVNAPRALELGIVDHVVENGDELAAWIDALSDRKLVIPERRSEEEYRRSIRETFEQADIAALSKGRVPDGIDATKIGPSELRHQLTVVRAALDAIRSGARGLDTGLANELLLNPELTISPPTQARLAAFLNKNIPAPIVLLSAASWVNLVALAAAAVTFSAGGFFLYEPGAAVLNSALLFGLAYVSYRFHEAGHQAENYLKRETTRIQILGGDWLWGGLGVPGASGFSGVLASGAMIAFSCILFSAFPSASYQLFSLIIFNAILSLSLTDWRDITKRNTAEDFINAILRATPTKLGVSDLGTEAVLVMAVDRPADAADLDRLIAQLDRRMAGVSSAALPVVVMTTPALEKTLRPRLSKRANVVIEIDPALGLETAFLDMRAVEATLQENNFQGRKLILAVRDGLNVDWSGAENLRSALLLLFGRGFRLVGSLLKNVNAERRERQMAEVSA